MKIKKGVVVEGLKTPIWLAIIEADRIWRELGQELVVTSGLEGKRDGPSLHPLGFAADFRIRYFKGNDRYDAFERLRKALGNKYQVILKGTHIHVEYDHMPFGGVVE